MADLPPARTIRLLDLEPTGLGLAGRRLSPFVGREPELTLVLERLEQVHVSGHGHVVVLKGEPGAGKSRLLLELRHRLGARHVRYLEGHCASHGAGIPYLLLVDLLRRTWCLDGAGTIDEVESRARAAMATLALEPEPLVSYLLALLGSRAAGAALELLSPEALRTRTFDALQRVLRAYASASPLVLLLEDLHWIDRTSEAFLAAFVETLPGAAILLAVTARPGYEAPWLAHSFASQLALTPLDTNDGRAIVHSVLAGGEGTELLTDQIVGRAEGNPFFLEELAWAVRNRPAGGQPTSVPVTIAAALTARIDRLPAEPRRVLETAAVIGREVPLPLLEAVTATPKEILVAPLRHLVAGEFLYEHSGPSFIFKHALTQDVAYSRLPDAERRRVHLATAQALVTSYADRTEEIIDRLAHHYAATDDHANAAKYLTRFAEKATSTYALSEAVVALKEALAHAERMQPGVERDRCIAQVIPRFGLPLILLGQAREALEILLQRKDSIDRLADGQLAGPYYFWCAHAAQHLAERELATRSAERAVQEATRCSDRITLGHACYELGVGAMWAGELDRAVAHEQRACALLEGTREQFFLAVSFWFLSLSLIMLGRFSEAHDTARRTRSIGEAIGDSQLQSYGWLALSWIAASMGDIDRAVTDADRAIDLAPDPLAAASATIVRGYTHLEQREPLAAIARLERAVMACRQMEIPYLVGWGSGWLAEAERLAGRSVQARIRAQEVLTLASNFALPIATGLAHRTLGLLAHTEADLQGAAAHLTAAIGTFSSMGARYEVARTRLCMAEVAHKCGDDNAARFQLDEASTAFEVLGIPVWAERALEIDASLGGEPR